MMHRGYMRKGVSLEVIVEEDDNAEVSLDPVHYQDESDSSPSSPTLSMENDHERYSKDYNGDVLNDDIPNHIDRLRQEKEKRRKLKEEERWQNLERQRSLSCETLTILDVGDDEFSREQWEVETRDWDSENPCTRSEIEQSISRRKILASRLEYQDKYDEDYPPETRHKYDPDYPEETRVDNEVDEVEMENGRCWNPDKATEGIEADSEKLSQCSPMEAIQEDKDETNGLEEEEDDKDEDEDKPFDDIREDDSLKEKSEENLYFDIELNQNYNTFNDANNYDDAATSEEGSIRPHSSSWLRDPFANEENSWITVGELDDEAGSEPNMQNNFNDPISCDVSPLSSISSTDKNNLNIKTSDDVGQSPKMKHKEVRFSEQLEFVHEQLEEKSHPSEQKTNLDNAPNINEPKEQQPDKVCRTSPKPDVLQDNLVSVKAGRHLFESKSAGQKRSHLADRLSTVLETPDIMIVEKVNHSQNEDATAENTPVEPEVTHEMNSPTYNVHNVELNPKELPPPHTVASVRQLFEKLPTFTLRNVVQFNLLTRYDHVRSNPTSKILRFDRHEHSSSIPVEKPKLAPIEPLVSPEPQTRVKITPEMIRNTQKRNIVTRPPEDYSTTGVHLRKPQLAHGFDVQKALRENPRYFHIRMGEKVKKDDKRTTTPNTSNKGKRNTVTYTYLEAKRQPHSGTTTSLRWTKESIDRSDSESMSSESSEDSGVSRDFTSSIISSFSSSSKRRKPKWRDPNLTQEEYGSDPSFKWIDPTVLAKIRARGTTVIYFGPRHRPQEQSRSPRRYRENLPSFEDVNEPPTTRNIVRFDDDNDAQYDKEEDYVAAYTRTPTHIENVRPKIVGVTHKKNPNSTNEMAAIPSKKCNNKNQCKPRPFLHMDSRILHMKEMKKKSGEGNSVIYDFTEKQA